jgi:hypothetical protein
MARSGKELYEACEALTTDDEKATFLAGLASFEKDSLSDYQKRLLNQCPAEDPDEEENIPFDSLDTDPFDSSDRLDPLGRWMQASWFHTKPET